jgi:hypothetical protein
MLVASLLAFTLFFAPCLEAANAVYPSATPAKEKKQRQDPVLKGLPLTDLTADEAVFHALNRLAYGPRPGDVERIKQIGLAKWTDQQLNPNSIDDKAVESRLLFCFSAVRPMASTLSFHSVNKITTACRTSSLSP